MKRTPVWCACYKIGVSKVTLLFSYLQIWGVKKAGK